MAIAVIASGISAGRIPKHISLGAGSSGNSFSLHKHLNSLITHPDYFGNLFTRQSLFPIKAPDFIGAYGNYLASVGVLGRFVLNVFKQFLKFLFFDMASLDKARQDSFQVFNLGYYEDKIGGMIRYLCSLPNMPSLQETLNLHKDGKVSIAKGQKPNGSFARFAIPINTSTAFTVEEASDILPEKFSIHNKYNTTFGSDCQGGFQWL